MKLSLAFLHQKYLQKIIMRMQFYLALVLSPDLPEMVHMNQPFGKIFELVL